MELNISQLTNFTPTGRVAACCYGNAVGLYSEQTVQSGSAETPYYLAKITAIAGEGLVQPEPKSFAAPLLLSVSPGWDIVFSAEGGGQFVYTDFGGAWNSLHIAALTGDSPTDLYSYEVEATNQPRFAINTGLGTPSQNYVSAIFSNCRLGLIGLQDSGGMLVPAVSDFVGSPEQPVSAGRIWGDFTAGVPATVSLAYLADATDGPFSVDGTYPGSLYFATQNTNSSSPSSLVALLDSEQFSCMDVAVAGDQFCLFAVTNTGAPLFATFDQSGNLQGTPQSPEGDWTGDGHWVTNPTIVATPGVDGGYSFAFTEMDGQSPIAIYKGTVTPSAP